LKSSFDDPDRVRGGSCYYTCVRSCEEVHPWIFLAIVEGIGNNLFAVAVGEEVDRSSWDYPYKCRSQAFEQSSRRFVAVYVTAKMLGVKSVYQANGD